MLSAFFPVNVQTEAMGSDEDYKQMVLIDSSWFNMKMVSKGKFCVSAE